MAAQTVFEDLDVSPSRFRSFCVQIQTNGNIILLGGCHLRGIKTPNTNVPYHLVSPHYQPGEVYLGAVAIHGGFRLLSALPNPQNHVSEIARHEFFFGNIMIGAAATGNGPADYQPMPHTVSDLTKLPN